MKRTAFFWLITFIFLVSCAPTPMAITPVPITVQFSFATQPWLADLYNCAGSNIVTAELRAAAFQDLQSANMVMRLGQPENLTTPAYQIGTDDLLVVVNPQNPVNKLTVDQVRGFFSGRVQTWKVANGADEPVQVWVFPSGEDVQQIFEQTILNGGPVASTARLANNPDEMSQAVSNDLNAIGILTRHWKSGNTSDVFTVASNLPVLAITPSEPQGALSQILTCLQK